MELGVFLFKDIWIEVLLHRCLCPDVEGWIVNMELLSFLLFSHSISVTDPKQRVIWRTDITFKQVSPRKHTYIQIKDHIFTSAFTCVAWSHSGIARGKLPTLLISIFKQSSVIHYSKTIVILSWASVYLAWGINSVFRFMVTEVTESLVLVPLFLVRANSIAKDSFSSTTITLVIGLLLRFGDTQAVAISTAFQTELVS